MRQHRIAGHGGVGLEVFDLGPETARPLIMIHGWSQHHLSWQRQYPLSERFRLILPDLRGHGASDKPDDAAAYDCSAPWAGDVAAIISSLNLDKPLLVGWSMGGWVVNDYIRVNGDTDIAGLCLIGSSVTTGRHSPPDVFEMRQSDPDVKSSGMYSDNQHENLAATIRFVSACFAAPLPAEELALMVGFNMLCPPHVRKAARLRHEDYRADMAGVTRPALVLWGGKERLAPDPMGDEAVATIPGAQKLRYATCGHAPFWEDAARFNADLGDFASHCFSRQEAA